MRALVRLLKKLDACSGPGEAIPWARNLPEKTTMAQAWARCPYGDWMVWLLSEAAAADTAYADDAAAYADDAADAADAAYDDAAAAAVRKVVPWKRAKPIFKSLGWLP